MNDFFVLAAAVKNVTNLSATVHIFQGLDFLAALVENPHSLYASILMYKGAAEVECKSADDSTTGISCSDFAQSPTKIIPHGQQI
jgi:hypothetical protein